MKTILISGLLLVSGWMARAQETKGTTPSNPYFVLSSFVPEQGKINSEELIDRLKIKMIQIASSNGMGGEAGVTSRFVLLPKILTTQFENAPSAPPKVVAKMDIVLFIADASQKKVFTSKTFKSTGIGKNEQEAYLNGVQNLPASGADMAGFIAEGKSKIVEYYNNNCDRILKDVSARAATQQFDAALEDLLSVPPEATVCYEKAMNQLPIVFKQRQEFLCGTLLQKANAEMAAGHEDSAAVFLGQILPGTKCFDEAQKTVKKLNEQHMRKYQAQLDLQKDILKFIKEYALADAANRPKIYDLNSWMR
ncbi:MAG TPA: hypothetical protein PK509_12795 [Catalimonadaceae bacterium]|nr:hypothetical protein [Catalimonadaceae bacterium]HPI12549.1 hypothetical protein [Catalimonadaceae bacterium]